MRVLNLYCGIGGNRKLWEGVDVTAVDINDDVLEVYAHYNPDDEIVRGDAHQYLLEHHDEFDFVWSSPPCQTHSKMVKATRHDVRKYPDMALYQEILRLQEFHAGPWVVENVEPYYPPLIAPRRIGRHCFWSNRLVRATEVHQPTGFIQLDNAKGLKALQDWLGIHWDKKIYMGGNHSPGQAFRNAVHPELGRQVFESVLLERQAELAL